MDAGRSEPHLCHDEAGALLTKDVPRRHIDIVVVDLADRCHGVEQTQVPVLSTDAEPGCGGGHDDAGMAPVLVSVGIADPEHDVEGTARVGGTGDIRLELEVRETLAFVIGESSGSARLHNPAERARARRSAIPAGGASLRWSVST